jgi:putative flippase GtrA
VRFVKFNSVGVAGFVLQIAALAGLLHFGVHYLAATLVAVESAILHNFFWHERWTWRDRPAAGGGRLARLFRFHALNGMVSLVGNLLLMRLFVGTFGMPAIPANLVAVLACALVNYFASDRFVFRPAPPGGYGEAPSAMSSCDSDVA